MKLKKGDKIIVLAGKDKGKTGTIERVYTQDNSVLVPGIHIVKKHAKKRDEQNPGGILEIAKPINVSKVALIDPKTQKATRVGYEVKKGEKVRIAKKSGQVL